MTTSSRVVQKYSTAIFLAAKKHNKEKKISKDLDLLVSIFKNFHAEIKLINNPIYPDRVRLDFIEKLSKKNRLDKLTKNFLGILSVKKRLNLISQIAENFNDIKCKEDGLEKVEVVSTLPLTSKQNQEIEDFFKKNFKKKIRINNTIDPNIISGIMIKIGAVIFDNSLLNKITRLKLFIDQGISTKQ
ncbi:MAG: ATP synthase F1 subunit delta [Alphaproteobacteria bacterium]|nr:ATP synthase F1 subunit delta [Alphaproteobacteria bacterium]